MVVTHPIRRELNQEDLEEEQEGIQMPVVQEQLNLLNQAIRVHMDLDFRAVLVLLLLVVVLVVVEVLVLLVHLAKFLMVNLVIVVDHKVVLVKLIQLPMEQLQYITLVVAEVLIQQITTQHVGPKAE